MKLSDSLGGDGTSLSYAVKITDQSVCRLLIENWKLAETFTPQNGRNTCYVILNFKNNTDGIMPDWLIGSKDNGFLTFHLCFNTTQQQAWALFRKLCPPGEFDWKHNDSRIGNDNISLN